ncbi:MAG: hypothetical protein E6R03_08295 [Hyphomicrobiaceae bacterium]|nr:MAG: hypothetical protein E6R03_08295 [Hyphomicrobiaceae bacterium]
MIRRSKPIKRSPVRRKNRPKKRPKSELVLFKKKLWEKFSAWIKKRDGNICFVCGKTDLSGHNWHAAHVFSAGSYSALRWLVSNCFSGCYSCNVGKHGHYIEYHRLYKERFGEAAYNDLYEHRYDQKQWRLPDLQEIEKYLDSTDPATVRLWLNAANQV